MKKKTLLGLLLAAGLAVPAARAAAQVVMPAEGGGHYMLHITTAGEMYCVSLGTNC